MSVSVNGSGIATVSARMFTPDIYFTELWVDDSYVTYVNKETNIAALTFDMKKYPVGFHTVKLFLGSDVYDQIEDDGYFMFYGLAAEEYSDIEFHTDGSSRRIII